MNKHIRDLYTGISEPKSNQLITNSVKDENVDQLAHSHILNRWKNFLSLQLNVHKVYIVRQMGVHTDKTLIHEPITVAVKIATTKFKIYKSPSPHSSKR
jgi:hypothetical protein